MQANLDEADPRSMWCQKQFWRHVDNWRNNSVFAQEDHRMVWVSRQHKPELGFFMTATEHLAYLVPHWAGKPYVCMYIYETP